MASVAHIRRRAWLLALTLTAVVVALLVVRDHISVRPAEHSPGYHLDPTELADGRVGEVGDGVRVLCYHYFRPDVDPAYLLRVVGAVVLGMPTLGPQEFWTTPIGQFERHLRWFRDQGIAVVTLDEIADLHARGEPLPDPAVIITIDDADRSVYTQAWPLLQEYGVRAHLFVPTGRVGEPWSGIDVCSWSELREMADSGTILLGSHTHDLHFKVMTDLGNQPVFWNPDRIDDETIASARAALRGLPGAPTTSPEDPVALDLLLSRRLVERHAGRPCRWLAWPYGFGNGDLDSLAAAVGYDGTLSLRPVTVENDTPPWHIGRFTLTAKTTPADIASLFDTGER